MRILIIEFQTQGVSDADLRQVADELAPAFAAVDGLERKYWLADEATSTYGGVYVFKDQASLDAYLESEIAQGIKTSPAFTNVSIKQFGILDGPTAVTMPGGKLLAA